jgi:uncharacterized protein YbjT (DUF2867 family)
MASSRVTVFGGSGFLGRQIVKRLAADGAHVRVAVRHPERASFLAEDNTAGPISAIRADVWEEASVGAAVEGSEAVINMVGHYVERSKATFEATRGRGALHVARASAIAGVQRLIHISGVGADRKTDSPHARARGIGERLVKEAFPGATIFRPSIIFGLEGEFLNRLAALARVLPVLPLFGAGETKLQPVLWAMSLKPSQRLWPRPRPWAGCTSWAVPGSILTRSSCSLCLHGLDTNGC